MASLEFTDMFDCYQAIGEALSSAVPEEWKRITVEVKVNGVQVTIIKHYQDLQGVTKQVPFIPVLGECFYQLARFNSTQEKGFYKQCHFALESDGKYHADFEY